MAGGDYELEPKGLERASPIWGAASRRSRDRLVSDSTWRCRLCGGWPSLILSAPGDGPARRIGRLTQAHHPAVAASSAEEALRVVIVGADVHKRTHTFVAVDGNGKKLAEKTVDSTNTGHSKALNWVRLHFGAEVVWGIEDVRQFSGRLERDLLAAGQRVVRVPPNLTARSRTVSRSPGKSDPIDALAVARAVLREPDLPVACHDEVSREFKLLVDRREDLVGQRTSTVNRLSGRVHELDPVRAAKPLRLNYAKHRQALRDWLVTQPGLVAELARDELADVDRLTEAINVLGVRISERVGVEAPSLLAVPGCGTDGGQTGR
jgi:transposase